MKVREINRFADPDRFAMIIYNNFKHLAAYPELTHNPFEIKRILLDENFKGLFVYDQEIMIAYLIGERKKLVDGRNVFYISYLYVNSRYRFKNIGSQLLDICKQKATRWGCNQLLLTCQDDLVAYYKKKGFIEDKIIQNKQNVLVYNLLV